MGRVKSLSESGFPKAPPRCHQLTRGVNNNIGDESPGVWGKSPVFDPLLAGRFEKTRLWAGCMDCKAGFCDEQCRIEASKHDDDMA